MRFNSQITHSQITNCDWLSFSVRMKLSDYELATHPKFNIPPGYIMQHYTGTNLYKQRAILYTESGDKVLTLLYEPHSRIICRDSLFVEVSNRILYTNFDYVLDLLQHLHDWTWQSLSRFDIATDFNPTDSQYHIIDMLQSGAAYVSGKREGSMFHNYQQGGKINRVARCLSWGSKYSDVKFKLYNKTKEIFEIDDKGRQWCNKPYIHSMWLSNGLDPKQVWRLEVSIMGASSYQWHGHKLSWYITHPAEYHELFYDLYTTRFQIRANQGHQYKRYDKLLDFLQVPADIDKERLRKVDPEAPQKHTDHAATIRNLIKELERPETQCNRKIVGTLLDALNTTITAANLEAYFQRSVGKGFDEWADEYCSNLP